MINEKHLEFDYSACFVSFLSSIQVFGLNQIVSISLSALTIRRIRKVWNSYSLVNCSPLLSLCVFTDIIMLLCVANLQSISMFLLSKLLKCCYLGRDKYKDKWLHTH